MTNSERSFDLASVAEPWVLVVKDDDHVVNGQLSALASSAFVRQLDSSRMTSEVDLFREFANKLDFPSYFGHNWYALVDCLDDFHGTGHGRLPVVIIVKNSDVLIDRDFFPLFLALLCEAAERANLSLDADGLPRDRSPFPLHFVFFLAHRGLGEVAEVLRTRDDMLVRESDGRLLIYAKSD